ncbi:HDOD domain-containing protein [Shewanella sp. YIC-542]|uniref:HDOD domain-containing protein n=1 Tax=Shewanella mytili TaxID=3377111 RepID=UPI00398F2A3A
MVVSVSGGFKPAPVAALEYRFLQQLIMGTQTNTPVWDDPEPALEAVAFKLEIEREAALQRIAKKQQSQQLAQQINQQLHMSLKTALANQLASAQVIARHSKVTDKHLLLLEMLHSPKLDLNRLRLVVASQPWLIRDLTNMVNSPVFGARRPQNSELQVTDLKLVLGYIGLDNLRLLIPFYICRHWLPFGHSGLLWINRKLWRYAQIQGVAARALAQLHDQDGAMLYSLALMRQLGTCAVLEMGATIFEQLRGNWLKEASHSRDKALYDAIAVSEFPAQELCAQVAEQGMMLNWQLPVTLGFSDSRLIRQLQALQDCQGFEQMPLPAQLVAKASCYAQVLLLDESHQLSFRDKQLLYGYYNVTEQELLRLQGQNYKKLTLF